MQLQGKTVFEDIDLGVVGGFALKQSQGTTAFGGIDEGVVPFIRICF